MSGLQAANHAGVLFVEDFDEEPAREEIPLIVPPAWTAQDVQDAREEGRNAGAEEARADQAAIGAALCHAALAAIGDALARARADVTAIAEHRAEEIAGAILAVLGAALPAAAARLAPQEVSALLAALLPPLAHMPDLALRVHPAVLADISAQITGFAGITVTPDETLAPSDVSLIWQDGAARRDWAAIWTQLSAALSTFALPADLSCVTGS